jgi:hypothetical protein
MRITDPDRAGAAEADQQPYATVTLINFATPTGKYEAINGLRDLLCMAQEFSGFQNCWVLDSGPTQAIMITRYSSQEAAARASGSIRPHLTAAVGPYVTGTPQRWAGRTIATSSNSTCSDQ